MKDCAKDCVNDCFKEKDLLSGDEVKNENLTQYKILGLGYYRAGESEQSLSVFEKVLSLEPENPQNYVNLAAAYSKTRDVNSAHKVLFHYFELVKGKINKTSSEEVVKILNVLKGRPYPFEEHDQTKEFHIGAKGRSLFKFMFIADAHVGQEKDKANQDTEYLRYLLTTAYRGIRPLYIINGGDLTDSTNGEIIPCGGPYLSEWNEYQRVVRESMARTSMPRSTYHEIPGNHDQYADRNLIFYLNMSNIRTSRHTWILKRRGRIFQFMCINTTSENGLPWPLDLPGLDNGEIGWIEKNIYPKSDRIFIFGHHPIDRWKYGQKEFIDTINKHNCIGKCVYFYGHTHRYGVEYEDGLRMVNVASLGKSSTDQYIVADVNVNGGVGIFARSIPAT